MSEWYSFSVKETKNLQIIILKRFITEHSFALQNVFWVISVFIYLLTYLPTYLPTQLSSFYHLPFIILIYQCHYSMAYFKNHNFEVEKWKHKLFFTIYDLWNLFKYMVISFYISKMRILMYISSDMSHFYFCLLMQSKDIC